MMSATLNEILARGRAAQLDWNQLGISRRCAIVADLRREVALQCEAIAATMAHETSKHQLNGYGRYHGAKGLDAFSRTKTIMRVCARRALQINWFPFSSRTTRQLAGLIRLRHGARGLLARISRLLLPGLLTAMLPSFLAAQSAAATDLLVVAHLPREAHGELAYTVFASPAGFPVRYGPPRCDECSFHLGHSPQIITVNLVQRS
jgi:hypothetical protein